MRSTRVSKQELLDKLNENRAKHKEEFESARQTWEKKVVHRYEQVRDRALHGDFEVVEDPLAKLPKPQNFIQSYDMAIEQLDWETKDEVELDEKEFANYVLDKWDWQHRFAASTSIYNSSV